MRVSRYIHFEFKDGEIQIYESIGRPFVTVYRQKGIKGDVLGKLISYGRIIKTVEDWLEKLPLMEREAIFWRYINHDFERTKRRYGVRWKTLSYREIGLRMGISKRKVQKLVKNGIRKIIGFLEGETL